jgi:hypothetical protein
VSTVQILLASERLQLAAGRTTTAAKATRSPGVGPYLGLFLAIVVLIVAVAAIRRARRLFD